VLLAGLDLVDLLDGMEIDGVDRQPLKGVGRQGDDTAFSQARDDVIDPVRLRFFGMDAQNLRRQGLPRFPMKKGLQRRKLSQHQPWCKLKAQVGND